MHIALAFTEQNGTSGTWSFYVNGDLSAETSLPKSVPAAGSISIGDAFVGQIDELEIYTRGACPLPKFANWLACTSWTPGATTLMGCWSVVDEASVVSGAGNSKVSHALDLNGSNYVDLFPSIGVMNSMPRWYYNRMVCDQWSQGWQWGMGGHDDSFRLRQGR